MHVCVCDDNMQLKTFPVCNNESTQSVTSQCNSTGAADVQHLGVSNLHPTVKR